LKLDLTRRLHEVRDAGVAGKTERAERSKRGGDTLDTALKLWRGMLSPISQWGRIWRQRQRGWTSYVYRLSRSESEAMLAMGRHSQVISELEGLTLRHRTRERFWEQLMLAIYRSGRPGDALNTFFSRTRSDCRRARRRRHRPACNGFNKRMLKQDPSWTLLIVSSTATSWLTARFPPRLPKTRKWKPSAIARDWPPNGGRGPQSSSRCS